MLEEFDGAFAGHVVAILVQNFPVFIGVERPVFRYIGKYAQDGAEPFLFKTVKDGKHGGMIFPVFLPRAGKAFQAFSRFPPAYEVPDVFGHVILLDERSGGQQDDLLAIARSSEINARREFE